MKINGWDISGAQARQWNVTPDFSSIENESEWQRGSPLPFFVNGSIGVQNNTDHFPGIWRGSE